MILVLLALVLLTFTAMLYWVFFSPSSQLFGRFPYHIQTDQKLIALTFDDGPNEPYTSQIVDFLDSQEIKATFFQVGQCVKKYPEITKHIYRAGHVIGNHSWSHRFSHYFYEPSMSSEIQKTQVIIQDTIGRTPALFRPPWLYRQPALFKTVNDRHLQMVSGIFCHPLEVLQPKASRIAKHVLAKVKPGSIIIFHDGYNSHGGNRAQTVEAVKLTINGLEQRGYKFVTVDQLLGLKPYQDVSQRSA